MELIETIQKTTVEISLGRPHNVILFNDNVHEIREAVAQIEKAIHCGNSRAYAIAMEAERCGRAIVITAWRERCEHVAAVLEEIDLGTKIEPA
jgi:ATP-dependent Clp protease adapter protein ClpS